MFNHSIFDMISDWILLYLTKINDYKIMNSLHYFNVDNQKTEK